MEKKIVETVFYCFFFLNTLVSDLDKSNYYFYCAIIVKKDPLQLTYAN